MKNNTLLSMSALSILSAILIFPNWLFMSLSQNTTGLSSNAQTARVSSEAQFNITDLSDEKTYLNLPVNKVETYKTENAWGTAIFIPQTHRYPGSEASDKINDSAEKAQKEMYEIISFINKNYGLNYIMTEGDLYGKISNDKIEYLSEKIKHRNLLARQINSIEAEMKKKNVDSERRQRFSDSAKSYLASIDREIYLQGAPFKLKAENQQINLYGAENKKTQDESTIIVRNYIYGQDRQKQLNNSSAPTVAKQPVSNNQNNSQKLSNAYELLKALKTTSNNSSLESEFNSLANQANYDNDQELLQLVKDANMTYQTISNLKAKKISAVASTPSREDNPYKNVTNKSEMNKIVKETEKQIQAIVIDRRNAETATNFAQGLKENNVTSGIIQFGAGHEEGLIKELNNQGLNVIVVTSDEVSLK